MLPFQNGSKYEKKAKEVLSKFICCMSVRNIEDIFPTQNADDQMKGALQLLTPEQIDILCSDDKHMIIYGPYGSGKSIIARTKAEMLADNLRENELTYYIIHDSRTALSQVKLKKDNIIVYPNEKGKKLSHLMKDILKTNGKSDVMEDQQLKKINLIVDEYNSEELGREEAENIKEIIYSTCAKEFEDAVIMLVSQSMRKKREMNNLLLDSNRFAALEEKNEKQEINFSYEEFTRDF